MDEKEQILKENFNEYHSSALEAFNKKRYNTSTTLFFKALVALCDLFILIKEKKAPSSHAERFRILEDKYQKIYRIADRDFPFYQDSYTKKMDEETARLLKDDVEELRKIVGI